MANKLRIEPWISQFGTAVGVFAFILLLPILLLIVLALLAGLVVFGALAAASMLMQRVRGVLPHEGGRENVRVIPWRE